METCTVFCFGTWKNVGGGHWEEVTTSWPKSWTMGIRGSSIPPMSLECTFCSPSHSGRPFRTQPWESTVVLRPSELNVDWTQWRLLYKLLRFQLTHVVIYSCCGHECSWYESANWKNPENTIIRGMGGYTQIWVGHVAYPGLLTFEHPDIPMLGTEKLL